LKAAAVRRSPFPISHPASVRREHGARCRQADEQSRTGDADIRRQADDQMREEPDLRKEAERKTG
jgi:hypothetical protein